MSTRPNDGNRSFMDVNAVLESQAIEEQLHRILSSPEFKASIRQKNFLRFVVERSCEGRTEKINGYTIATEIFGRNENFEQKSDPIVSIEARRLRRALEHYYLVAGTQDPLWIDIPKGGYVPTFRFQAGRESACSPPETELNSGGLLGGWPSVFIRSFQNFSENTHPNFIAEGFTTELAIELARYQDIQVLMKPSGQGGESTKEPEARFLIDGSVRHGLHELKVAVHLIDQKTHNQIWGDIYHCNLKTADLFVFQEEVAQIIAAMIAEQEGFIARTLSLESRNKPPSNMETYEAIHKFYKFETTYSSESFHDALEALEHAAIKEPECYQIWMYRGGLYTENYGLEIFDMETPIEKGVEFAEKAVQLNPSSQRARLWLAEALLLNNQLAEGMIEAQKALALNPKSLIFLDVIGYALALLGDWEQGCALIQKALNLNPFIRAYSYYILCWNWLRKKEYEKAYLETLNFRLPSLFWDPALRAITLGHMGRFEEGNRHVEKLLMLKPDFPARGRILIRHFIKSEELAATLIEGLRKSGLNLG
jgi:adenylate cyclase